MNSKETIYKIISIFSLIFLLIFGVFSCYLTFIERISIFPLLILILFFLMIMLISFAKWIILKNNDNKIHTQKIVELIIDKFPEAQCEPNNYIDAKDLFETGIIPYYDYAYGSYLTTIPSLQNCTFCNIALQKSYEEQNQEIFTEDFFKGQLLIININNNQEGHIRLISKNNELFNNIKPRNINENKISLESIRINENFNIYTDNPHTAYFILTSTVINRLESFLEKYKYYYINIYIENNKLFIIIKTDKLLFESDDNFILQEELNELTTTITDLNFIFT